MPPIALKLGEVAASLKAQHFVSLKMLACIVNLMSPRPKTERQTFEDLTYD